MEAKVWYLSPAAELSQGDIVQRIPFGPFPHPTVACKPADSSKPSGPAAYGPLGERDFTEKESAHLRARIGPVLVLWHDCQLDRWKNKGKEGAKTAWAGVAPIQSARQMDSKTLAKIQEGLAKPYLFLPASVQHGLAEDSYVDFRLIVAVKQALLVSRTGSLSEEGRDVLYSHLFSFLTDRVVSTSAICPHCQQEIPGDQLYGRTRFDPEAGG